MQTAKKKNIVIIAAACGFLLASCSQSPTSSNGSANLIPNPTLRADGNPSLAGWRVNDTSWVKVVANAPGGSETWSLWLAPASGPGPGGSATAYITGQSGEAVYNFSCWERNFAGWYWGTVSLTQMRDGMPISQSSLQMRDTSWTLFSLADTLAMRPSDTLTITLGAPSVALIASPSSSHVDTVSGGVCFNQLKLVKGS